MERGGSARVIIAPPVGAAGNTLPPLSTCIKALPQVIMCKGWSPPLPPAPQMLNLAGNDCSTNLSKARRLQALAQTSASAVVGLSPPLTRGLHPHYTGPPLFLNPVNPDRCLLPPTPPWPRETDGLCTGGCRPL